MKREEKKLAYREKHAEEAMLDICSKHMMLGANAVVKDGYRNGFDDGVKWADKTMIEKACEWLDKTLYIHKEEIEDKHWNITNTFEWVTSDYDSVSDFIDGFKKAMKGE